jgi:hypothetical protein
MSIPVTFLLFGAAVFLALAAISIIRGVKLKERAYCINGGVCVLLSLFMVLLYFNQVVLGIGFFIAGAIIGFANFSKSMKTASREAVTQHKETDLSRPFRIGELFSWGGWFKIASRWGTRKALLFYVLFNLVAIWFMPVILFILNIGSSSFIAGIAVFVTIVVVITSVPVFYQQVIRNLESKNVEH